MINADFKPGTHVRLHGGVTVANLVSEGIEATHAEVLLGAEMLEVTGVGDYFVDVRDPRGQFRLINWHIPPVFLRGVTP